MTLEELEQECTKAEAFWADMPEPGSPGFNVFVNRIAYGEKVRLAPGLQGRNLGHYPSGTMVYSFAGNTAHPCGGG